MSNAQENIGSSSKAVISKTNCYELLYHAEANRVYFCIKGFWKNKTVVPDLLKDVQKALAHTQQGFTLLADFSAMVTHPQQLNALHVQLQKRFAEAGLSYGAYVEPLDKIANFQIEQTMQESGVELKRFGTAEEAEVWLNSISLI